MSANPKYELLQDQTIAFGGHTLYRIRALRDFGDVKAGDIGGFVESETNLSHDGNCWVADNAKVWDNAQVKDNARIIERAKVCGEAKVWGEASICRDATVEGRAQVWGTAQVYGDARVKDNALIRGYALVGEDACVSDDAQIFDHAQVYGGAMVGEQALVYHHALIDGNAQIGGNARVSGDAMVGGNAKISGNSVLTSGTHFGTKRASNSSPEQPTLKTVQKEIAKGDQYMHYTEIVDIAGEKLKISIKSDAYESQTYARIKVFSPTEKTWNDLASIHYSKMQTPAKLVYKASHDDPAHYQADRNALIDTACSVLGIERNPKAAKATQSADQDARHGQSFDAVAEQQGWTIDSQATVMRNFIEDKHMLKELAAFASDAADEENSAAPSM